VALAGEAEANANGGEDDRSEVEDPVPAIVSNPVAREASRDQPM
jgi:hypothetical protein